MDKHTEKELKKVTANVPEELADKLVREEIDTSEEEFARFAIKHGGLRSSVRRQLEVSLARGDFRRSEKVVDENVVKELEKYHKTRIQKLRAQGIIPDPKTDPWLRAREARLKKKYLGSITLNP